MGCSGKTIAITKYIEVELKLGRLVTIENADKRFGELYDINCNYCNPLID